MLKLDNMRDGEVVEKVIRRHWMAFLSVAVYALLSMIIIIAVYVVAWFNVWVNLWVVMFSMISILFVFVLWLNSELDLYVITNKRIIWVDQISFLNRKMSECSLKDVQEVNSSTRWLLANILNYGTLTIQTAWTVSNFHMSIVPNPLQTARQVLNIVDHNKKKPTLET